MFKNASSVKNINSIYDKKLRPTKIKITQFTILSLIASGEGKTVNSLSGKSFNGQNHTNS